LLTLPPDPHRQRPQHAHDRREDQAPGHGLHNAGLAGRVVLEEVDELDYPDDAEDDRQAVGLSQPPRRQLPDDERSEDNDPDNKADQRSLGHAHNVRHDRANTSVA
jgi:hypothetical protein